MTARAVSSKADISPRRKRWLIAVSATVAVLATGAYLTRESWLRGSAEALVCESSEAPSDAIFVDFVVQDYRLFERARALQERGLATPVLIPLVRAAADDAPRSLALGVVDLLCRTAGVSGCSTFDAPLAEPISLNVARRAASEIQSRGGRSVLLVTAGLRSRRAALVYSEVFRPLGIAVHCQPVFGIYTPANWTASTHGIQEVGLQWLKLWYYRAAVLR